MHSHDVMNIFQISKEAVMMSGIEQELEKLVQEYGFTRPDRGLENDTCSHWREGKPNYCKADLCYFQGKSKNHQPGSLEITVENLVKKWEMEMTHKTSEDWTCVDPEEYNVQANGGSQIKGIEAAKMGTYNWLLGNAPKDLYNAEAHSFESSHKLFRGAFLDGFPWEVLEVLSGPPKVAFTWRHWGTFNGEYNNRKGQNEMIELYGFAIAVLSEDMKMKNVEIYTKYEGFLEALHGTCSSKELLKGKELLGSCCPLYKPDSGN